MDYLTEIKALAPHARHLHIHDSFGDPADLRTYSRSERLAYGLGDLHLPVGWGSLPWHELMAAAEFEPDVVFNLEVQGPYRSELPESVAAVREMIGIYTARRSNA